MSLASMFKARYGFSNNLKCRWILLDLLNSRGTLLGTRNYVLNLGPSTEVTTWFRKIDKQERIILLSPQSSSVLETARTDSLNKSKTLKRFYRTDNILCQVRKNKEEQDLVEAPHPREGQLTVGQKVKQAGKDASYMGVLLIGFGITGVLIWYVLSELLFSFSPNSVYSKALDIVKNHSEVSNAVGEPIKAYGEETSRGRRRHVSHQEYIVNGVNYMRVKFYISGSRKKATVHVDTKETSRGKFEFRYIFVELEGYPTETIVVEDNR